VRRIRGLADLAGHLQGEIDGRSCRIRDVEIDDGPVQIEGLQADRLEIGNLDVMGLVVFRDCFVADLQIVGCGAEGVLLIGCRVERLVVRNLARGTRLRISGGDFGRIAVHDVVDVAIDATECGSSLSISGVRRHVSLDRVTAGSITIAEQLGVDPGAEVTVVGTRVIDNFEVHDLHLAALCMTDSRVDRHLWLRRLTVDRELTLDEVRCESCLLLDGITCEGPVTLSRCILRDGVEGARLRRRAAGEPVLHLDRSRVGASMSVTLATEPGEVVLHDTEVEGQIVFPDPAPCYRMTGATTVARIDVPETAMRTTRRMEELAVRSFGERSAAVYGVMRSSFGRRQRLFEEDLCYFLQRTAESRDLRPPARWVARYLYGAVFGWGVRILPPVRAMALGIGLTAVVLDLAAPPSVVPDGDAGSAVTLAGALWFNVGTGLPSQLTSAAWSAIAVGLTAVGLLLLTVIVGITIRRLVR
jgi:hypothetical protein